MTSVIVTGAGGFLGTALVNRLASEGVQVRAISRATRVSTPNVQWIATNIFDSVALAAAFRGVEAIFHLAAHVHDHSSRDDGEQQRATTLGSVQAMLIAADECSISNVIFASSLAVFGRRGRQPIDENQECRPETAYGRMKLEAEEAIANFARRTGAYAACIRPAMMYGVPCPGNLPRMVRMIKKGRFPRIPEFANRRSMVFVDDAAAAMVLAWKAKVAGGRPFIVTDDEAYSTREIYDMILNALGRRAPRLVMPKAMFSIAAKLGDGAEILLRRRLSFDSRALDAFTGSAWFDASRAKLELGYGPTTKLRDIMPALVRSVAD